MKESVRSSPSTPRSLPPTSTSTRYPQHPTPLLPYTLPPPQRPHPPFYHTPYNLVSYHVISVLLYQSQNT